MYINSTKMSKSMMEMTTPPESVMEGLRSMVVSRENDVKRIESRLQLDNPKPGIIITGLVFQCFGKQEYWNLGEERI